MQNADTAPGLHQRFKILPATEMCQHYLVKICSGLHITTLVMGEVPKNGDFPWPPDHLSHGDHSLKIDSPPGSVTC